MKVNSINGIWNSKTKQTVFEAELLFFFNNLDLETHFRLAGCSIWSLSMKWRESWPGWVHQNLHTHSQPVLKDLRWPTTHIVPTKNNIQGVCDNETQSGLVRQKIHTVTSYVLKERQESVFLFWNRILCIGFMQPDHTLSIYYSYMIYFIFVLSFPQVVIQTVSLVQTNRWYRPSFSLFFHSVSYPSLCRATRANLERRVHDTKPIHPAFYAPIFFSFCSVAERTSRALSAAVLTFSGTSSTDHIPDICLRLQNLQGLLGLCKKYICCLEMLFFCIHEFYYLLNAELNLLLRNDKP